MERRAEQLPQVAIRPAKASDSLCIALLGTQVFLDTYAVDGIRPSLAREAQETLSEAVIEALLAESTSTFLVAETNCHLIGFVHLTANVQHELVSFASPTELKRLYVQERFTGRGLGKALLSGAEAVASASGAAGIWLAAWSGNARALRFYASQRYEDLGPTLFTVQGEQCENRLFAKSLELPGGRGNRPHLDLSAWDIDQLLIRRRGEEATEGVRPILADSHNHSKEVAAAR